MISLELATEASVAELPETPSLGIEIDQARKSDRGPSLWQSGIIDRSTGPLVHIFDKAFVGSETVRWLFEAVDTRGWERFRFKDAEEQDFFAVLKTCLGHGSVWLLADAQFGPKARVNEPQTLARFLAYYRRAGIRINSAVLIRP